MPKRDDGLGPHGGEAFVGAELSLRARARLADVVRIPVAVEGLARADNWAESHAYQVTLAIEEICTAIVENLPADAGGDTEIAVALRTEAGAVTLEIAHEGPPFNALLDTAEIDLNAPVEERMASGLGANLVVSMMDDWDYVREAQLNRVTLVKRTR